MKLAMKGLLLVCLLGLAAAAREGNKEGDDFIFGKKKSPYPGMGKAKSISKADTQCVVCQYLVERIKGEMLMNGINGGVPFSDGQHAQLVGVPTSMSPAGAVASAINPATMFSPPPPTANPPGAAATAPDAGAATGDAAAAGAGGETANFLETQERIRRNIFQKVTGMITNTKSQINFWNGKGLPMPNKEKSMMLRHFTPPQIRYANMYDGPARAAKRAQERFEDTQMQTVVFKTLEGICEKHMPQPFYQDCFLITQKYEDIAEALKWKDRPAAICINLDACNKDSYVIHGPHEVYKAHK